MRIAYVKMRPRGARKGLIAGSREGREQGRATSWCGSEVVDASIGEAAESRQRVSKWERKRESTDAYKRATCQARWRRNVAEAYDNDCTRLIDP